MTALNLLLTICIVALTLTTQVHSNANTSEIMTAPNSLPIPFRRALTVSIKVDINKKEGDFESLGRIPHYQIVAHKNNWHHSSDECAQMGMQLVSLVTQSQTLAFKKFVWNNHGTNIPYWINACKDENNNFYPGPCIEVTLNQRGQLLVSHSNTHCEIRNYFICETL